MDKALSEGRDVLFDIDWQGAAEIARKCPEDAVRVFILPPSLEELRRRLVTRSQDSDDVIERRVANAKGEIASVHRELRLKLMRGSFGSNVPRLPMADLICSGRIGIAHSIKPS
ncbi:MAG: hypothetical protein EBW73_04680, partial [Betaproteobacteria bacterium]|nr:hypothetical protein [Betaproteobacteria bacterium]